MLANELIPQMFVHKFDASKMYLQKTSKEPQIKCSEYLKAKYSSGNIVTSVQTSQTYPNLSDNKDRLIGPSKNAFSSCIFFDDKSLVSF